MTAAVIIGLVAAVGAGAAWAGIVLLTNYEIGWAAWGIGIAVGLAMAAATSLRSTGLALITAFLALVGLGTGKALVAAGSAGPIASQILEHPDHLEGMMAWRMYYEGDLDPGTHQAIRRVEESGDTISDALWAEMLDQASVQLSGMGEDGRQAFAEEQARAFLRDRGLVQGVTDQLSGFDLLWVFLAVGTAFGVMNRRPEEA